MYNELSTLAPAVQRRGATTSFLRDTFFGSVFTAPTETVDMDFYKNRQVVAPFVADGVNSINIKRDGIEQKQYKPPMLAPSRIIDKSILSNRQAGENPFSPVTEEERAQNMMQRDYNELTDSITRSEEKMVADLLQTGKIVANGYIDDSLSKSVINTIDYGFDNIINVAAGDKWPTANPINLIDSAAEIVRKGGYDPSIMILGSAAAKGMLSHEGFVKAHFDSSRANLGFIDPKVTSLSGNGYTLMGMLTMYNMLVYRYDAWYYDSVTGQLKPYIDPGMMIMGSSDIGEMCYGAITIIDDDKEFRTYESTRVPQIIVNQEGGIKKLILKSRPIPKPNDVSSWAAAEVA